MAIPFHKGQRPYEGLAFQCSHHVVHEDGTIEHAGEFLHAERGEFPNYDFVRAFDAWKCCCCGEVIDSTILANRARNHNVFLG